MKNVGVKVLITNRIIWNQTNHIDQAVELVIEGGWREGLSSLILLDWNYVDNFGQIQPYVLFPIVMYNVVH